MVVKKVWLIPFGAVFLGTVALTLGFSLSIIRGHFPRLLPSISVDGIYPPEVCLFTQLLNMSAFFLMVTIYLRHRQIVEYYGHRLRWENSSWRTSSTVFMWIGLIGAVGVTIFASFPKEEQAFVHYFGVSLTFCAILIYAWGQVIIGYVMIPRMASALVNYVRFFLVLTSSFAFMLYVTKFWDNGSAPKPISYTTPSTFGSTSPTTLKPSQHLKNGAKDVMIFTVFLFILSFVAEMRFAYAHAPRVVFKRTTEERPPVPNPEVHRDSIEVPTLEEVARGTSDW